MFGIASKKDIKKLADKIEENIEVCEFVKKYPHGELNYIRKHWANWGSCWQFTVVYENKILKRTLPFREDADIDYAELNNGYVFVDNNTREILMLNLKDGFSVTIPSVCFCGE